MPGRRRGGAECRAVFDPFGQYAVGQSGDVPAEFFAGNEVAPDVVGLRQILLLQLVHVFCRMSGQFVVKHRIGVRVTVPVGVPSSGQQRVAAVHREDTFQQFLGRQPAADQVIQFERRVGGDQLRQVRFEKIVRVTVVVAKCDAGDLGLQPFDKIDVLVEIIGVIITRHPETVERRIDGGDLPYIGYFLFLPGYVIDVPSFYQSQDDRNVAPGIGDAFPIGRPCFPAEDHDRFGRFVVRPEHRVHP